MAEWRELCEAFEVDEAKVPHRKGYSKGQSVCGCVFSGVYVHVARQCVPASVRVCMDFGGVQEWSVGVFCVLALIGLWS
jgi:hypothetical protein